MKRSKLINRLFGGKAENVFRGMATLALGSGVARLSGIAAMPFLTRIYTPANFGTLSIYIAIVSILAPLLTLRYVLAIPLPRNDIMAANILAICAMMGAITSLALSTLLWRYNPEVLSFFSMEALIPWWWLIAVGAIGMAFYEAMAMWATRCRDYKAIATSQIIQNLVGNTIKIVLGVFSLKSSGLMVGQFFNQSGGAIILWPKFRKDILAHANHVTKKRLLLILFYYKDYPTYRLASQFLLIFSMQAPLLLSAAFFDTPTTGQLGLAIMALTLPANLIGDSMAKAFYAEISKIGKKQVTTIKKITNDVIKKLGLISILPAIILFFFGEQLFIFAFGSEWLLAGQFASILTIYLIFQFIQKPVSYLMFLFNGQKQLLYLNLQRTTLTVGCFYLGSHIEATPLTVVTTYSVCMATHYLLSILVAVNMIKKRI